MRRLSLLSLLLLLGSGDARGDAAGSSKPVRWEGATKVMLARPTEKCEGLRRGEWVRLQCAKGRWARVQLLGGSATGVELMTAKPEPGVYAIFPGKPGDRRLLVVNVDSDTSSYTEEEEVFAVISEVWMPGEAEPTITVD